jgi:prepilin-type N-terminal cleavage/methylation domain-containing protein
MKNYFIKNKYEQGFTLVETLVAVAIFTVSILALMFILTDGISDTVNAKKKVAGAYLAQEGIEYIRNMRDTYVLYSADAQTGWDAFKTKMTHVSAQCQQPNGCYFDDQNIDYSNNTTPMTGLSLIPCGTTCAPLYYDSTTGKYNYVSSGADSGFIRKINFETVNTNEVKISSTVSWKQDSGSYDITFSENLFNWVE